MCRRIGEKPWTRVPFQGRGNHRAREGMRVLKMATWFKRNGLSLIVTACLAAAVLTSVWLPARAYYQPGDADVDTGTATSAYLPLIAQSFPSAPPIFGVQMRRVNNYNGMAQALAAGMHWVRFSTFRWHEIEPVRTSPPQYDWTAVDEESLRNAEANGMEVVAVVHFTPEWAQKYPGSFCGPIKQEALDAFAEFLTTAVNRYSASPYGVRYWELWNEPDTPIWHNGSGYGCWGEEHDDYYGGGYYAEMLKKAYPAIKAADPNAQVLLGGLLLDCGGEDPPSNKDCSASKFLEGIMRNDGGRFFDGVSYHAYTYYGGALGSMANPNWPGSVTAVPEKTAFVRQVLEQYGYGDKYLINTEAALLCATVTSDCTETQAIYIPRAYAEALALGLKGQAYFALINEGWRNTGLVLPPPELTPKPAYHAYVAASLFLSGVNYEGKVNGYPRQIEGYSFRRANRPGYVDVIWSADGSRQDVTLPAGASAYDRYGDLIATSGVIQVNYSPVYVTRP